MVPGTDSGEALIVVPDYDYFKVPRHGYTVEQQEIDDDQYAVMVTRQTGTIADIVRRTSVYQKAAEAAGFELVEEKKMFPTETQIAKAPKYAAVKDQALTVLLRFRRKVKDAIPEQG